MANKFFFHASNTGWDNAGVWWSDTGHSASTTAPATNDTVRIDSALNTGPASPITLASFTVNTDVLIASGATASITVTTTLNYTAANVDSYWDGDASAVDGGMFSCRSTNADFGDDWTFSQAIIDQDVTEGASLGSIGNNATCIETSFPNGGNFLGDVSFDSSCGFSLPSGQLIKVAGNATITDLEFNCNAGVFRGTGANSTLYLYGTSKLLASDPSSGDFNWPIVDFRGENRLEGDGEAFSNTLYKLNGTKLVIGNNVFSDNFASFEWNAGEFWLAHVTGGFGGETQIDISAQLVTCIYGIKAS